LRRPDTIARAALLGVAGVVLALAGCGAGPAASPDVTSPVDGVVLSVDAVSLTEVRGFVLRTTDGASLAFKLGPLENATSFSPSHLKEHQATSEPIRVWFRIENGERIAYRIEDASA